MRVLQVMARAYVAPEGMDDAVAFYERLLDEHCEVRFPLPDLGIEIAAVGSVHLVAGDAMQLAPFRQVTAAFFRRLGR